MEGMLVSGQCEERDECEVHGHDKALMKGYERDEEGKRKGWRWEKRRGGTLGRPGEMKEPTGWRGGEVGEREKGKEIERERAYPSHREKQCYLGLRQLFPCLWWGEGGGVGMQGRKGILWGV